MSLLDSRQGDRDLRNVGCSGGIDRDRLPIGLGRHGQIRCESDAIDFTANSRAGNRPGDVADRIAPDLIPFAGETGSRRGYIAFDVELVAVARTEQALLERRAVRCHVVVRLAANSLTRPRWARTTDRQIERPHAGSVQAASASGGSYAVTARPTSHRDLPHVEEPVVFVIDDDASVREALSGLFRSVGLRVEVYGSASDFLQSKIPDVASCLILDIRLPRLSGLEFQAELVKAGIHIPIIFMTGHGDIPMSVQAMKAGAVDFLTKPFRDQDMLDAVAMAIERDRRRRLVAKLLSDVQALFEILTLREREVLALVAAGRMNKQIAAEIGLAEITVKIHRGNVMKKMGAKSLADLVRMAEMLGIRRAKPSGAQT